MLPQDAYAPVQTWKDATIMSIPEIREEIELIKKEISEIEDQIFDEEEDGNSLILLFLPFHQISLRLRRRLRGGCAPHSSTLRPHKS